TVDAGAKVTVRFSSGPGELEVPDVSGMSQDQARQTLEGQGFDPGGFSVETTDQAGFDKGEVVGTDPEAGTKAAPDDPITIILRSEEHTSELQSRFDLVCRLLLEKRRETR